MKLKFETKDDISILLIQGDIDRHHFAVLKAGITKFLRDRKKNVVLNFAAAEKIDDEAITKHHAHRTHRAGPALSHRDAVGLALPGGGRLLAALASPGLRRADPGAGGLGDGVDRVYRGARRVQRHRRVVPRLDEPDFGAAADRQRFIPRDQTDHREF